MSKRLAAVTLALALPVVASAADLRLAPVNPEAKASAHDGAAKAHEEAAKHHRLAAQNYRSGNLAEAKKHAVAAERAAAEADVMTRDAEE